MRLASHESARFDFRVVIALTAARKSAYDDDGALLGSFFDVTFCGHDANGKRWAPVRPGVSPNSDNKNVSACDADAPLQWGDIDWQGHFLVVQRNIVRGVLTSPKSHQRRRVDMTPQLEAALLVWRRALRRRWLKKGEPMPSWVFPSLEGTALEERNVRTAFTRVLEKAKLRQIRIHDLRHTYATLLLQAGAPITYVSQQLGHRDASITLRVYAHWLPDRRAGKPIGSIRLHPSASPAHPESAIDDPSDRS